MSKLLILNLCHVSGGDDARDSGVCGSRCAHLGSSLQAEFNRTAEAGSGQLEFIRRLYRLEFLLRLTHRKRHVSHGKLINILECILRSNVFEGTSRLGLPKSVKAKVSKEQMPKFPLLLGPLQRSSTVVCSL